MFWFTFFTLVGVALAGNGTYTWTTLKPKPTEKPHNLCGRFGYGGCYESGSGFPSFNLAASSPDMTLEMCAASCSTELFGVYNNDCYCGDTVETKKTRKVEEHFCNAPCPGDHGEQCGGLAGSLRMSRHQNVPLSVLLTVCRDGNRVLPTLTSTVTTTVTETITKCPQPDRCTPSGTVYVTTVTTTWHPVPTKDTHVFDIQDQWEEKTILCYGDYCAPRVPCTIGRCNRQRIVCKDGSCRPEDCGAGEPCDKLVICEGDRCFYPQCQGEDCHQKVVCYDGKCIQEPCYGSECERKFVCTGTHCSHETCQGDECYKKLVCEGETCNPAPTCGRECPAPPPPGPAPFPTPAGCIGPDCAAKPPCEGPQCPPPCSGSSCPNPKACKGSDCGPAGPPCRGPNCPGAVQGALPGGGNGQTTRPFQGQGGSPGEGQDTGLGEGQKSTPGGDQNGSVGSIASSVPGSDSKGPASSSSGSSGGSSPGNSLGAGSHPLGLDSGHPDSHDLGSRPDAPGGSPPATPTPTTLSDSGNRKVMPAFGIGALGLLLFLL